jgi:hypothetical protein
MECIAVDWSGALTGAADRIWFATACHGELTDLVAPGSRAAVADALLARLANPMPVLAGLDFAFALPAWYAAERGWQDVRAVWAAARDEGESWLRDCAPPFWGRPGTTRPHAAGHGLRATERASVGGPRPKSVFQVGGAGSVGTGSIRGMPMLLRLRDAGWAVWPFDAPSSHTLVEIWPRHFTGPVVKSDARQRADHLAREYPGLSARWRRTMAGSEDAFDAGLTAIGMTGMPIASVLERPTDPLSLLEGWICDPLPGDQTS